MNGKQTRVAVCPCCGCERPIKNEGYLYVEEWEVAFKDFAYRQCDIHNIAIHDDGHMYESYFDGLRIRRRALPSIPREITYWLNANPRPRLNREQFIHSLGVRIAALEQKGGRR